MAVTAITSDFVLRSGLVVQGTAAVTSSTEQVNAAQIDSGISVAKNIIVGTTATVYGDTSLIGSLSVTGTSFLNNTLNVAGTSTLNRDLVVNQNALIGNIFTVTNGTFLNGGLTVQNASTLSGTLSVSGTSTINGPLIVNNPAIFNAAVTVSNGNAVVIGTGTTTIAGTVSINNTTSAILGGGGTASLKTVGGSYIGGNLIVNSTASSTATNTDNALYVAGGTWLNDTLYVNNVATFNKPVIFNGTATYVLSTNTVYTDNIISIHIPPGGAETAWTYDDTKDIGLLFHYYRSSDSHAFLGLAHDSGYLEWYNNGTESSGTFTGSSYGTFKTADLVLVGTNNAINTYSGSLQIAGGAVIAKDLRVSGQVYINGYQALTTASTIASTLQQITQNGASTTIAMAILNATSSISTDSGAFTVVGGVGIGGSINVASTSYINSSRILVASDLATVTTHPVYITNNPALVSVATTSTTYGTYNTGTVASILTASDYTSPGGYYSISDTATQPGYIAYIGFTGVTNFTRLVANVNYTVGSTHTIDIDLYNYITSSWDTFAVYSGTTNYYQFVLQVDNDTPYISGGIVTARFYHASLGNIAHETRIDYVALEDSIQGGQGPRGATGATGAIGPQGLTTSTTSTFNFFNTLDSTATNTGSVVVSGGVGIAKSLWIGSDTHILGDIYIGGGIFLQGSGLNTITASTGTFDYVVVEGVTGTAFIVLHDSSIGGNLNVSGISTLTNLIVSGQTTMHNSVSDIFTSTTLVVTGQSTLQNVTSNITTITTLTVIGQSTLQNVSGASFTITNLTVTNNETVGGLLGVTNTATFAGNVIINNGTQSVTTNSGALTVAGGVGIVKDVFVGGMLTVGAITSATVVPALFSNNVLLSSYTSNIINTITTQNLDTFNAAVYRTARYTIQIVDGSSVHATEMTVFHDGANAYATEYGIVFNNGILGTFDVTLAAGTVTLKFTPFSATSMVIKIVRSLITA